MPEFWPAVLREFASSAEAKDSLLIAINGADIRSVGSSAAFEELCREHYTYPGGHERSRRLLALQRAGFVTDLDVYTNEEMLAEPVFADLMVPRGYGCGIATAIHAPTGDSIIFHAERPYSDGPYAAALVDRIDALRPHLARSALISARLAFAQARTAVETLAGLGLPACAVRQTGAVIVANDGFAREAGLWTTRGGDRIALIDRRADGQLNDALGLITTGQGVRSLPILGQDGAAPAVLHVVPIRRAAHDLFAQSMAILVLTKASDAPTQATSLLQALFNLTPAEAAVAARIAAGETAERIALADAKSTATVRNQLRSVLEKTGCHRQVDLARLLAQLAPGAR